MILYSYRGINAYFKVLNGQIKKGEKVKFINTDKEYFADEIGTLKLNQEPKKVIKTGDVGWFDEIGNGIAPEYTLDTLIYKKALDGTIVSAVQPNADTEVTITLNSANGRFSTTGTEFIVQVYRTPNDTTTYENTTTDIKENFIPPIKKKISRQLSKTQTLKIMKQRADSSEYHKIFNLWRKYDLYTTILATIGLILMIVNYEIDVWFFGI